VKNIESGKYESAITMRGPLQRRLRFMGNRIVRTAIGFAVAIVSLSAVVNTTMEATIRSQINEAAQGAVMGNKDLKNTEDILKFKRDFIEGMEHAYGLHKPRLTRIAQQTWNILTLDLGKSKSTTTEYPDRSTDVRKIILERLPHTMILYGSSTFVAVVLGIMIGTAMARKPGGKLDKAGSLITMLVYGTPAWWVASFMILFFVYGIPIFRVGALRSPVAPATEIGRIFDYLSYLALPFLTLVFIKLWSFSFFTRSMVVLPMQEDYVHAARGRGIPESKILRRHGLRVAAPGLTTMAAQAFAQSFAGDILVEKVLARPGIGLTLYQSIRSNDIGLTTGILAIVTLIYCLSFTLLDFIYAWLDPRIAYGRD
jgi:peptide/nickel transport system permease protein